MTAWDGAVQVFVDLLGCPLTNASIGKLEGTVTPVVWLDGNPTGVKGTFNIMGKVTHSFADILTGVCGVSIHFGKDLYATLLYLPETNEGVFMVLDAGRGHRPLVPDRRNSDIYRGSTMHAWKFLDLISTKVVGVWRKYLTEEKWYVSDFDEIKARVSTVL